MSIFSNFVQVVHIDCPILSILFNLVHIVQFCPYCPILLKLFSYVQIVQFCPNCSILSILFNFVHYVQFYPNCPIVPILSNFVHIVQFCSHFSVMSDSSISRWSVETFNLIYAPNTRFFDRKLSALLLWTKCEIEMHCLPNCIDFN